MRRAVVVLITSVGLLVSCEGPVCACLGPPPLEIVYGRVESAAGTGIPTAVVLYRLASDTACVFDDQAPHGEIDVGANGRFRSEVSSYGPLQECLELRAFDPATGEADTVSILTFVDFANPDSTGVVLRLP
jgi:hypothetical protein